MTAAEFTKKMGLLVRHHCQQGETRKITTLLARLRRQGYYYCKKCKVFKKSKTEGCKCAPPEVHDA